MKSINTLESKNAIHPSSEISGKKNKKHLFKSLLDYRNDRNRFNLKTKIKKDTMKLKNQNSKLSDDQLFLLEDIIQALEILKDSSYN